MYSFAQNKETIRTCTVNRLSPKFHRIVVEENTFLSNWNQIRTIIGRCNSLAISKASKNSKRICFLDSS